ncbi:PROTEIN PHOSPHATASE 2C 68-RELATED [Salix koriyanagi]|uniref:protein-serine/threonine phosphatase n=1 Tax=Salix koriyanagi TaxID=2511006 RepID=A0A9Q0VD06_9ROSI|nr:PROTEIN PHOSPHATASE 2C 68-RELATED [Salix koriyanagi]
MSKDDILNDDDKDSAIGDSLLWSRDLEKHSFGEFSFSVVQANEIIEDHSQVETGRDATFIGVYDGHGGPDASQFISDHLFLNLMRHARERGTISEEILRSAVSSTEDGFLTLVRRSCGIKPLIAAVGSCCLVGVIWRGTLFVANLGDSRAVIGSLGRSNTIVAEQLTRDHNASMEEVRQELKSLHPDDSHIVVMKHGVWRIKGIIQVSRSIGDAYLKRPEFSLNPSFPRFHLPEPIRRPEAVEIVYSNPRAGIARRLVRAALNVAARKRVMRYDDLKKVDRGIRRFFHDDITVVVIFIDHELLGNGTSVPEMSVKGFRDTVGPSDFNILQRN